MLHRSCKYKSRTIALKHLGCERPSTHRASRKAVKALRYSQQDPHLQEWAVLVRYCQVAIRLRLGRQGFEQAFPSLCRAGGGRTHCFFKSLDSHTISLLALSFRLIAPNLRRHFVLTWSACRTIASSPWGSPLAMPKLRRDAVLMLSRCEDLPATKKPVFDLFVSAGDSIG